MKKQWLLIYLCLLMLPASLFAADQEIILLAGGDVLFTPHLKPYIEKNGHDYPLLAMQELLKSSDVVFANLEVPLTNKGKPVSGKRYTFRCDPIWAKVLARNGFNILSLANNHILDYGPIGLEDTIRVLNQEGIKFSGAGETVKQARQPAWLEVKGVKIACLSYSLTFPKEFYAQEDSPGTAFAYAEFLEEDIPAAAATADILMVSFHWSEEMLDVPKEYQRKLAHKVIDLGADIVLGHHPHILQGVEVYHGKLIAYSLGNWAFSNFSKLVKTSMLLRFSLGKQHVIKQAQVIPLTVDNFKIKFQPKPLFGKAAHNLLCDLDVISQPFGEILLEGDVGEVSFAPR